MGYYVGELGKTFDLTFSNRFLKLLTEGAVTTGIANGFQCSMNASHNDGWRPAVLGMGDFLSPDSCYITSLTWKMSTVNAALFERHSGARKRCTFILTTLHKIYQQLYLTVNIGATNIVVMLRKKSFILCHCCCEMLRLKF